MGLLAKIPRLGAGIKFRISTDASRCDISFYKKQKLIGSLYMMAGFLVAPDNRNGDYYKGEDREFAKAVDKCLLSKNK